MAFNKKFSPDRRGRGEAPASGQRTYSRGGYQQGGADNGGRQGGGFQAKAPQQRRFGPTSQRSEQQPAREGEQRGRGSYGKTAYGRPTSDRPAYGKPAYGRPSSDRPAYGKPAYGKPSQEKAGFERREPQRGNKGKPQGFRPQRPDQRPQRGPGRPMPQQGPFGRPAPQPVQPVAPMPAPQPEGPPENLLSGRNPIREALKTGRDIERLLVASGELSGSAREIVAMAKNAGIVVQVVERSRLDQITHNHQGMVAFASAYPYASLEEILDAAKEKGEEPFLIVLDQITDPHNLGAIIRTAACVGAHGVIVQQHRAVGLTPAAVRASAGAVEHVKVAKVVNINNTIRSLKKQGIWFYAADAQGKDYRQVQFAKACALVIGSEGDGISALTLSLCDEKVSIPMSGAIDSLNASVAAGILMYAAYAGKNA